MAGEDFDTFARTALARMGVSADETDLAVMRAAESVYGPDRDALMGADLSGIPREHDLDPSRPPNDAGPAR